MMHDVIVWMGGLFTPEQYVFWTRLECSTWTAADFVIVYSLLRIGSLARQVAGRKPHRAAYLILAATIPFAVFIPVSDGMRLFVLELFVTIPHFLLILCALAMNAGILAAAVKHLAREE